MGKKSENKLRYNILMAIVYIIGIILLLQLFNLQIVNGKEYREESNTRLTRETTIKAARGNILDSSGEKLVSTKLVYNVEIYKTKIDNETLNNSLLLLATTLESNGDKYVDNFPITVNPYAFENEETAKTFKTSNKLDEGYDAEACFNYFKEKYKISNENVDEALKIMILRYEIEKDGYSNTKSVELASNISNASLAKINEMSTSFPGISTTSEPTIYYPYGTLASHILGYVGPISEDELKGNEEIYDQNDVTGKTGIEQVFEKYLRGTDGVKQIDMSVDGIVTDEYVAEEAIAGSNVVLTIDSNLQQVTEQALEANIKKINSGGFGRAYTTNAGSCVVMNVKTGEILAMASYPNYDPADFVGGISTEKWNQYNTDSAKPLMNKAVQNSYEPGSIFKMVTAIAGLESGVITRTEKINDVGMYRKYGEEWPCWYYTDYHRGHGYLNVSQAIERSCNYFFYETGDRMGIETLAKYARYFGLGQKTGVELPSEASGAMATPEYAETVKVTWTKGQTINASIGQGLDNFSPLQMAKYISMLANGGNDIDVTIIKSIIKPDGTEASREEINNFVNQKLGLEVEEESEDITISQETMNAVLEGMRSVTTDETGTAYSRFQDFGIAVGGKTGSAESRDANGNDIVNAWFAGFAPYDDPEIAVVVMVENGGHGNYTAEAVVEIMQEYFGMNTQEVQEDMSAVNYNQSLR